MSFIGWFWILICLCTLGSLFFSVTAIALRIFSHTKLQEAFKQAGKENLTEKLVENTEKLILTSSFCRTITNICILLLLVYLFAHNNSGYLSNPDYFATVIISIIILSTFSLAIPHAWAKYGGEKFLCLTYKTTTFFAAALSPMIYIFKLYDGLVRRLAGVAETTPQAQQEELQEEFLTDLEQHKIHGGVDQEELEMIENVLELSDTEADEIMTPRTDIIAVEANSDLPTILKTVNSAGHSRLPVYEENIDNIIGLIYAKDLLGEIGKDPAQFKLREKLRQAHFVPETKPLRTLLHEFQNKKLHIAVVLDEYGGTAGIVTIEDVLEELVGEITDEYEKTPPKPIRKIDANTIAVDARTYIDDLNDEFELNLPEDEDYDTIGGFVFSHLGYIPKTSETFDYQNLKFTITSAEIRKIKRLRIQKISEQ